MNKYLEKDHLPVLKEGQKIKGKVLDITSRAVYVDLGIAGTGIIYGKEIKDGFGISRKTLSVGDEITAAVIEPENEDGYVELSIAEAVREEAWKDLQEKEKKREPVKVRILDANKGGLIIELNGIRGFMPVSQLTAEHYPRVEDGDKNKILEILKKFVDTEMTVCVINADPEEDKLIVSEKEAFKDKEKEFISEFKVGDIVEGEVSGVVDFGAFIKFLPPSKKKDGTDEDKLEGLVHISQLDWQLINNPRDVIKVGDKVKAKIISIDDTRISLSIRALKDDPWMSVKEKYQVGGEYKGKIKKFNHFGAFVYLDDDIHGLAHVSSFPGYPRKSIDEVVELGKEYMWRVMSIEPDAHRMGLKFVGEVKKGVEEKKTVKKQSTDKAELAEKQPTEKKAPKVTAKKEETTDCEKKEEKKKDKTEDNAQKKESKAKKEKLTEKK